jgi:hypothetical protein
MTWRAEEPTPFDPLEELRADDRALVESAEHMLEIRDLTNALLAWLERYPPIPPGWLHGARLARALRLRYLDGLSVAETAKALDRSPARALELVNLGLARLRHAPEELLP